MAADLMLTKTIVDEIRAADAQATGADGDLSPEGVAEVFLFPVSSAARSFTGQTLVIHGGFTDGDFGWVPMARN